MAEPTPANQPAEKGVAREFRIGTRHGIATEQKPTRFHASQEAMQEESAVANGK
jgi:hypothetical protein